MKKIKDDSIMLKLVASVGKIFEEDKWSVYFVSPGLGGFNLIFEQCEHTKPFYGKEFSDDEIKELIVFLEKTLQEKGSNEQNNLE